MGRNTQGNKSIQVTNPSRIAIDGEETKHLSRLRSKIAKAIDNLLNTVVDTNQKTTVKDELGHVVQESMSHVKEWLRRKKVGNEKIEAETYLLLEKARDMYERRQSELADAALNRERKSLENFEKKIGILEKLLVMHNQLEPNAVVDLVGQYVQHPLSLPAPGNNKG